MRLNQLKSVGVAGAAAALIIGCVVAPVVNVANQPVLTNRAASLDEIGNAIVRAGVSLNMQMLKVEPGLITATHLHSLAQLGRVFEPIVERSQ